MWLFFFYDSWGRQLGDGTILSTFRLVISCIRNNGRGAISVARQARRISNNGVVHSQWITKAWEGCNFIRIDSTRVFDTPDRKGYRDFQGYSFKKYEKASMKNVQGINSDKNVPSPTVHTVRPYTVGNKWFSRTLLIVWIQQRSFYKAAESEKENVTVSLW